jgi:predicted nuclease of predicted toxin-antitoxin system
MRLLADVHVKTAYVTALRSDGHAVERVVDVATLGQDASDGEILAYAREQRAVICTNDTKDFVDADDHPGVVIVPQTGLSAGEVAAAVTRIERTVGDTEELVLHATSWV